MESHPIAYPIVLERMAKESKMYCQTEHMRLLMYCQTEQSEIVNVLSDGTVWDC